MHMQGVPWDKIVYCEESTTTIDSAVCSKRVCIGRGLKRILLVVSRFQAKRTSLIFRKVFGNEFRVQLAVCPSKVDMAMKEREKGLEVLMPLISTLPQGNHELIKYAFNLLREAFYSVYGIDGTIMKSNLSLEEKQGSLVDHL